MSEQITMELEGRIASITLNIPPVNAFTHESLGELASMFREIAENDDISVAVLRSALPIFSAGMDLRGMGRRDATIGVNTSRDSSKRVRALQWAVLDCPTPIISAVRGPAVGLGFMLPAMGDFIVAGRSASFGMPDINFTIGGAGHIGRIVPPAILRYVMLSGRRVSADYLGQMGALALVVDDDKVDDEAGRLAQDIAALEPLLVRNMKISMDSLADLDIKSRYAMEHTWGGLMGLQLEAQGRGGEVLMDSYRKRMRETRGS